MITVWEACGRAVCVRSDARGHVVRVRHGHRWTSVIGLNGRVKRFATEAEAQAHARYFLSELVADRWKGAIARGKKALAWACWDWLARHPRRAA